VRRTRAARPAQAAHPLLVVAGSPVATAIAAAWGAAEASVFFIVPDVWSGFVALLAPRAALTATGATVGGAVVGAALAFRLARAAPDRYESYLRRLPGIRVDDPEVTAAELREHGYAAFLRAPLGGQPVKLYVAAAARQGRPLSAVLLLTALNRLERLVPLGLAAAAAGVAARRVVRRRPGAVAGIYVAGWSAFYAAYWGLRSGRRRSAGGS
jgi:hypothetical protein